MKDIRQIHREAMELAKRADLARVDGDGQLSQKLAEQAYRLEKAAAEELISYPGSEPTRSVLFRSAASLAFSLGRLSEAKVLIEAALSGRPFSEMIGELQELHVKILDQIASTSNYSSPANYSKLSVVSEPGFTYGLQQMPEFRSVIDGVLLQDLYNTFSKIDRDRVKELYPRFAREAFAIASIIVPDTNALHDVFADTIKSFPSYCRVFDPGSVFHARTLLNLAVHYNSIKYRRRVGMNEDISFEKLELLRDSPSTIDIVKFFEAFDRLPVSAVKMLELLFEGRNADEIANEMGIRTGAVIDLKNEVIDLLPGGEE